MKHGHAVHCIAAGVMVVVMLLLVAVVGVGVVAVAVGMGMGVTAATGRLRCQVCGAETVRQPHLCVGVGIAVPFTQWLPLNVLAATPEPPC